MRFKDTNGRKARKRDGMSVMILRELTGLFGTGRSLTKNPNDEQKIFKSDPSFR